MLKSTICGAMMLSTVACAETVQVEMTYNAAFDLMGALTELDGANVVVKDGTRETVVKKPYKLGAGLRILLAKDKTVLKTALANYEEARYGLVLEFSNGSGEVPKDKEQAFAMALRPVLNKTISLPLAKFKRAELRLEENEIGLSTLSSLELLIEDKD